MTRIIFAVGILVATAYLGYAAAIFFDPFCRWSAPRVDANPLKTTTLSQCAAGQIIHIPADSSLPWDCVPDPGSPLINTSRATLLSADNDGNANYVVSIPAQTAGILIKITGARAIGAVHVEPFSGGSGKP